MRHLRQYGILAGLLTGLLIHPGALAQQTVFNVPSADVTPQNKVFLQTEGQTRFWGKDQYYLGTQYAALGIGHNTELDATLFNLSSPDSRNVSLGLGFKKAFPFLSQKFPEQEFKVIVGEMVPISFDGKGIGNWTYSTLSFRLPKMKTRLTAGVNYGTKEIFGRDQVSFIGAYEHPVTKRLSLIGDWYSGSHGNSYFIPGISVAFPKDFTLYLGYQIPNSAKVGKSGLVFELAKFLP